MAIHIALILTLIETLAMSAVLLTWARNVRGSGLLVGFLAGVATWIIGNELPNWAGIEWAWLAMALLSSVPITSAAFLHFCAAFCELNLKRGWLIAAYALAIGAVALSLLYSPGEFKHYAPFVGVEWVVVPNAIGWTTGLIWAFLAALGMLMLARGLWQAPSPQRRRQIAALFMSCGWGLFAMSGYAFAALDIPVFPWQVLAAPAYPVILVYGILRYSVFVANVWAKRALASAILIVLGLLVVSLTVALPFDSKWINAMVVAGTSLALSGPVWRVASRLVYPGGMPSARDMRQWRHELCQVDSLAALADKATALVSARMGLQVQVRVDAGLMLAADQTVPAPALVCTKSAGSADPASEPGGGFSGTGEWQAALIGFDEAPPGQRHLAEVFGAVLTDAATQVELAMAAEQRERERQLQARLAELGSLAATVAHDLRNPLNIIAMAVAMAPQDTRQEVNHQIARISRLAEDLLDYAKPWQVHAVDTDLTQRIQDIIRHMPDVEIGPGLANGLTAWVDPMRFDQAVCNLLTNARAAAGSRRVLMDADRTSQAVLLHVCDDGPGIPSDLRDQLFQPFASRSAGGTGLGLAIVARIMAAHGGSAGLTERTPWRTCFTLTFPSVGAPSP